MFRRFASTRQSTPDLEERFRTAAKQGSLADVKKCIAAGVNDQAKDDSGCKR
jgi:hypothetical protein